MSFIANAMEDKPEWWNLSADRQVGRYRQEMYFAYAIRSQNRNYTYVGITNNLERRFNEHNEGYNKTMKPYRPFKLFYSEQFETRIEARKKEKYLKSGTGREYLKKILDC